MRKHLANILSIVLCVYVLTSIIFPVFPEQQVSKLALFALLGIVVVFLTRPFILPKSIGKDATWTLGVDLILSLLTTLVFGYIFLANEPFATALHADGASLGNRSGIEKPFEITIGLIGLLLVLEAARRALGWTLAILSIAFLAYGLYGHLFPDWAFPHPPKTIDQHIGKIVLQNGGILGVALGVMFKYVFLFVVFGALLEATGATTFIIRLARRIFRNSVGGPAKVSVVSSGMMGSLSGSAVANTATTGTFTIPLMRGTGFSAETAGGVEAASSSGGALMPPIMGAGAYMMLELIDGVKYIEILQAAILPAILYYFALLLMVHLEAKKTGAPTDTANPADLKLNPACGLLFFGAFGLLIFLLLPQGNASIGSFSLPPGLTADKAAAICTLAVLIFGWLHPTTRLGPKALANCLIKAARSGVILVAAAACVGIILGVTELTGLGNKLPVAILELSQNSLLLGLLLLMVATIILGMGLPSVVCYLLMATIVGGMITEFGTVELSMHLFIFYFSMMSMVTPPVALAAYAASAISEGKIMKTAFEAFRFALIGFALPFAFVLKPELLLLSDATGPGKLLDIAPQVLSAIAAILLLAVGITGYARDKIHLLFRPLLVACALVAFLTKTQGVQLYIHLAALLIGFILLGVAVTLKK